ncbi:MAG TPA: response regulator transcription factor [Galbitalea sp.]|nr:response regulator transcription factor [Galbitalea sp.]
MSPVHIDGPHRVGIVDDHEIVAVALGGVIDRIDGLELVGVSPSVEDLLAMSHSLDLVILDLRLADGSSPINNVARLSAAGVKVLAFTSGEQPYLVRLAAKTDVLGVVRKSEPLSALEDALRRAIVGAAVVSTDWAAALHSDPDLDRAGLSKQEQNILSLFASGNKAQQVASQLGIALGTVDAYLRRIRSKYARIGRDATTKVDLYKRAVEDGFLPTPGAEE